MPKTHDVAPARDDHRLWREAVDARKDFDTAMRCLGALAAAGFVERCDRGWRACRREEGVSMSTG